MHLMIDFETLDTRPSTAVISVGAAFFSNKKIIASKGWDFSLQAQLDEGRTISESTLRWWFSQSRQAQEVFTKPNNPVSMYQWDIEFNKWVDEVLKKEKTNWGGVNIWGNGASFDVPLFESLYEMLGNELPYKFWNICCYRTYNRLTKCNDLVTRQGTHHNAEDDAVHQAKCVIAAIKKKGSLGL